ncbi:MAG: LysR family transcriptional regulator [Proteobacteria bacterium]|nr:LysR family transcriptional regulator [Pseudomonadota bacterium]
MNIQSIKYLSALAKYHHFGKAAKMCFVSQPTLSMQIKKLEDRLGVQLLERTNKSVRLTAIGATMAQHADSILNELSAMQEAAKGAKDPYKGLLKIGIIPTLAPYLLPCVVFKLKNKFPHLTYYFLEKQTEHLIEDLNQGKLDVAVLTLPVQASHFASAEFFKEEFLLAVPMNHRWANRKMIKASDLQDQELLLLDEGHCLREQALIFCSQRNASETKDFRATSLETLRHIIAAGVGMTLIPKLACRKNDGISYIPFSSVNKPSRSLGLVWRKSAKKDLLFTHFAAFLQEILESK